MVEAEKSGIDYLFKLRQTSKVKGLIERLFACDDWKSAGHGWEGTEARLRLSGWTKERQVIVLRREISEKILLENKDDNGQMEFAFIEVFETAKKYEYAVLVTSLEDEILTIAQHYRDRADAENAFDELKNQWGWCGFTTRDIKRCQIMARNTALIYNWWSLFVRLAIPQRHAEAITSRPLLLQAVGKQTEHAGQKRLTITSTHAKAAQVQKVLRRLTDFCGL